MRIPGFTATVSINNQIKHNNHKTITKQNSFSNNIIPAAPYWGEFKREGCVWFWNGYRKYSSILWGATGSWEKQCKETPAYITNADGERGKYFADQCNNTGFNMWGVFYVPESSCYR